MQPNIYPQLVANRNVRSESWARFWLCLFSRISSSISRISSSSSQFYLFYLCLNQSGKATSEFHPRNLPIELPASRQALEIPEFQLISSLQRKICCVFVYYIVLYFAEAAPLPKPCLPQAPPSNLQVFQTVS